MGTAVAGPVATITLAHAGRRNALGAAMVDALVGALAALGAGGIRVAILRAAPGTAIWSTGFDIRELEPGRDPERESDPVRRVVRAVREFPAPVIAMIEGSVWGGATELALACDIVVAAAGATFAVTPAKLGVPYSTIGVRNLMARVPPPVLRELVFSGTPIDAATARALGIINHVVAADALESAVHELAARIAANAPLAIAALKQQMNALEDAQSPPDPVRERIEAQRREAWESHDYREGVQAFLDKRAPRFTGT
ncbi:MAG: methylmalonyl-CoA decarboxylase [Gammaproteobacteria bacterium]|nr:methylmalonyl-CoA decarboxylase [Gammaproteobacteria bacterium]